MEVKGLVITASSNNTQADINTALNVAGIDSTDFLAAVMLRTESKGRTCKILILYAG